MTKYIEAKFEDITEWMDESFDDQDDFHKFKTMTDKEILAQSYLIEGYE